MNRTFDTNDSSHCQQLTFIHGHSHSDCDVSYVVVLVV